MTALTNIPVHVGVIMDGNGRWAKKRLMPRSFGHSAGLKNMIAMATHAKKVGVKYLTVYALSTENLSRPKEELDGLFNLFRKYFTTNVKKLFKEGARVKVIGDLSPLPKDIQDLVADAERQNPENSEFCVAIAMNYGARNEIAHAVNKAIERGEKITEKDFSNLLYTADMPDPDLIIRTGGEKRLSNFLMYQASYAELYFTDVLFPDFDEKQFDKAIEDFSLRNRRFGKV